MQVKIFLILCLVLCSFLSGCADKTPETVAPVAVDLSLPDISAENRWDINIDQSSIRFTALEKNQPFEGWFENFDIKVSLDPENPSGGQITAAIDLTSVDAGNDDRNKTLAGSEWFFTQKFPVARFVSDEIIQKSPSHYQAAGELSIKGVSRDIVLPFTLYQDGQQATAQAEYDLNRLEFRIGSGSFTSDKIIGYPVKVMIKVKANRKGSE